MKSAGCLAAGARNPCQCGKTQRLRRKNSRRRAAPLMPLAKPGVPRQPEQAILRLPPHQARMPRRPQQAHRARNRRRRRATPQQRSAPFATLCRKFEHSSSIRKQGFRRQETPGAHPRPCLSGRGASEEWTGLDPEHARAVIRGGYWYLGAYAGPFYAYLNLVPSSTSSGFGFRCCNSSKKNGRGQTPSHPAGSGVPKGARDSAMELQGF